MMVLIPDPRTSPAKLTVDTVRGWQLDLTEVERRIGAHGSRGDVRQRLGAYLRCVLKPVERKNDWQLAEANPCRCRLPPLPRDDEGSV